MHVQVHPQNGQALSALQQAAPLHPAGEPRGLRLGDSEQQGAVIQGDLVSRPGSGNYGSGDRNAPLAQHHRHAVLQQQGLCQPSHPQLGPLQVNDELGLHPRLLGGGPILLLQQLSAVEETGMGQVQPRPRHPPMKHLPQYGPAAAARA